MDDKTYSTNETAEKLMGRRGGGIAIDMPCELGFHCPVCEYEQFTHNGEYDERLRWSEYNAFLWCSECNRDYPSALCLDDIDKAIHVFLSSVRDAQERTP